MAWLDSLRYCALQLEKIKNRLQVLDETADNLKPATIIDHVKKSYAVDTIGELLVKREQQRTILEDELKDLAPVVSNCCDFLAAAARSSDTPKQYKYLIEYYGHAQTLATAAKAAGVDAWTAKKYARLLAPNLYALEPGRFKPVTKPWGHYGYFDI